MIKMTDHSGKIRLLKALESKSILCGTAMMSYIPSIGRVFSKGGVDKFVLAAYQMMKESGPIHNRRDFDEWHDEFVERVQKDIGITSKGKSISYGQGQKPVNVFLKVYVDWAGLPVDKIADRLRPYLHVPLDSVVMRYVRGHFRQQYNEFSLRLKSLAGIEKIDYYSWQQCFRKICPEKPLLIDVFWAVERFKRILTEIIEKEEAKRKESQD